ncbi:sigma-70 family RNA polymerase sigma factor [bacterium]|nr:MAG: sigma-70 family RNA polymerase sigma factor [bacterium]
MVPERSESSAIGDLLIAERPRLLAFLRRAGRPDRAEDDFGEVALRACRDFQATTVSEPRAWLYGIARHVLARPLRLDAPLSDETLGGDPQDEFERSLLSQTLDDALLGLSVETRTLLWQHHAEGRTLTELSESLGVSPEALAARLARARRKVSEGLSPESKGLLAQFGIPVTMSVPTRIWCPRCADARLQWNETAGKERVSLSCPRCHTGLFVAEARAIGLFQGSAGVTISRWLNYTHSMFEGWRLGGDFRCPFCSAPGTAKIGRPGMLECGCSGCGIQSTHLGWELALAQPQVRRFWREHGRVQEVREKDRLSFVSRRTSEVLAVRFCPETGLPT